MLISDGAMDGAIVLAIDIVLLWSKGGAVDDAMLIVRVAAPGAGGYPLKFEYPFMEGVSFEGARDRLGMMRPLIVWWASLSCAWYPVKDIDRSS